jgi:preprotein translocase subunit SecE
MAKNSPVDFFRQVNQERKKVTWPTRKETTTTTIMVFIMVVVASLFFLAVDTVLATGADWLLKLRG